MTLREQSFSTAFGIRNMLAFTGTFCGIAAIIASFGTAHYQDSILIHLVIGAIAAWAVVCSQARGFIYGRIFSLNWPIVTFLVLALVSPGVWTLLAGILVGLQIYFFAIAWLAYFPKLKLVDGDRLYAMRYPFENLIPIHYLAPYPLSPVFEPTVAYHWQQGWQGIPLPVVLILDPPLVHDFIMARTGRLAKSKSDWNSTVTDFRSAVSLLSLLEWLGKYESEHLDGAALAAAARLALYESPDPAKGALRDALVAFKSPQQAEILSAFDL